MLDTEKQTALTGAAAWSGAESTDPRDAPAAGLSPSEYDEIVRRLGRRPNRVELGMFGAMWSEHCGYKNSRPLLKLLPTTGPRVLQGPGENAGVVDVGHGLAIAMKVESHNHPSAIEPFQGAATGVGGILRDIFTMGARPIALLDSLRFGPLDEPRNRYLLGGVVSGISYYGNCTGVPTVGGEVHFDPAYSANPLVNCMCAGLLPADRLVRSAARGVGNSLLLVGADTGRDGIHGAAFASADLDETSEERRPAVQVGNPYLEKLLIEACLELRDHPAIVAMQDLGAAGITSACVEAAYKGGCGVEIDVKRVPRRETGMTPYEVMLSESQERMLLVVAAGHEAEVEAVLRRWDLHADVIGRVTDDGIVRVRDGDAVVVEVPAAALAEAPTYTREGRRPEFERVARALPVTEPADQAAALRRLIACPNIASKRSIFRQYDHMNLTNTLLAPGEGDAAVLRLKGTPAAIALCIDGNGRWVYLDPRNGGAAAVAEAARNVVCVGARPLAITNCLNFGNPERPEIYHQLAGAIDGMAAACRALGTPVVSGNVSLYNESRGEGGRPGTAVLPTPVVGMLGLIEDASKRIDMAFKQPDDVVLLLGPHARHLGGSEWAALEHGGPAGDPHPIDLDLERRLQATVLELVDARRLRSAHDCSDGGLAVALAECCIAGGLGLRGPGLTSAELFGEAHSRIVVSAAPEAVAAIRSMAERHGVPAVELGRVGGEALALGDLRVAVAELIELYETGLERALAGDAGRAARESAR